MKGRGVGEIKTGKSRSLKSPKAYAFGVQWLPR